MTSLQGKTYLIEGGFDRNLRVRRQVPLERDINIAVDGPFWVEVANPEHQFTAMLISHSRGICLTGGVWGWVKIPKNMPQLQIIKMLQIPI